MSKKSRLNLKLSVFFTCLIGFFNPTIVSADYFLGHVQGCNHYQSGMWVSRGAVWNFARSKCGYKPFGMYTVVKLYTNNNRWMATANSGVVSRRDSSATVRYQCAPVPYTNVFTSRSTLSVTKSLFSRTQEVFNKQISGHSKRINCA